MPHILPFDFGDDPINTEDFATLQCSVHKGDLPIEISWMHNNATANYEDGILVSKVGAKISTITIDSVQENHAGLYTCVAENRAGKTQYSAELFVNGKVTIIKKFARHFKITVLQKSPCPGEFGFSLF